MDPEEEARLAAEEAKRIADEEAEAKRIADEAEAKRIADEGKTPEQLEEERINALVEARLKPMKDNLDKAYAARDTEKERADKLAKDQREAHAKRLDDEGKHKEAYELRLAEERQEREKLELRNTELTRDLNLKDALKSFTFRNDSAFDMTFQRLLGELVKDEKGGWQHKSGADIRGAVKAFAEDATNSFLFKPKTNTGGGLDTKLPATPETKVTSLFKMSQADVIKLAQEGKLPTRK